MSAPTPDTPEFWGGVFKRSEQTVAQLTETLEVTRAERDHWIEQARAAEARVAELEAALREIEVGRNQAQRDRARRALDAKEGE